MILGLVFFIGEMVGFPFPLHKRQGFKSEFKASGLQTTKTSCLKFSKDLAD